MHRDSDALRRGLFVSDGQKYYVGATFAWLIVLQGALFWHLRDLQSGVCNSMAAWPLGVRLGVLIVLATTVVFGIFSWRSLQRAGSRYLWLPLGVITGTGISHSAERLSSGCIFDYWHMPMVGEVFFNLGDAGLFVAVLMVIVMFFFADTPIIS